MCASVIENMILLVCSLVYLFFNGIPPPCPYCRSHFGSSDQQTVRWTRHESLDEHVASEATAKAEIEPLSAEAGEETQKARHDPQGMIWVVYGSLKHHSK